MNMDLHTLITQVRFTSGVTWAAPSVGRDQHTMACIHHYGVVQMPLCFKGFAELQRVDSPERVGTGALRTRLQAICYPRPVTQGSEVLAEDLGDDPGF